MKKLLFSTVAVLAIAGIASAAGIQVVSKTIDPLPGQEVDIISTGGAMVLTGWNDVIVVGDGGTDAGLGTVGLDVPGTTVAPITSISFGLPAGPPATIWSGKVFVLNDTTVSGNGLIAYGGVALNVGASSGGGGGGRLAVLTLDGTGLAGKTFTISLDYAPWAWGSDYAAAGAADSLVVGTITVTPEPVSALLLVLGGLFLRRRR